MDVCLYSKNGVVASVFIDLDFSQKFLWVYWLVLRPEFRP